MCSAKLNTAPLTLAEKQQKQGKSAKEFIGELLLPVPDDAAEPDFFHQKWGKPSAAYSYKNIEGKRLCYVARYTKFYNGKPEKEFLPFTCYRDANGVLYWDKKAIPENRPLYRLDVLATNSSATVILTEGEKACEAACELFPDHIAMCSSGGANAAAKTDWEPLKNRKVIIWPDADDAGEKYALEVKQRLLRIGASCVAIIKIPDQVRKGWDAADALEDGFTVEDARSLIESLRFEYQETRIAPQFSLRPDGVYFNPDPENNEKPLQRVCSWLRVIAKTCDENQENWGRLIEWKDADGHKHQQAVPMDLFSADGAELRKYLLNRGVEITQRHKGKIADYIQGTTPSRKATSISKVGWHGERFALPDMVFPASDDMYLQNSYLGYTAFKAAGTLDIWQQIIGKHIAGNSRLILAACAAFAPPLLRLTGGESGGFHLRGSSSIGKSTALYVAASIWGGDPDTGYIQQWRSTANALEATAEAHNDSLLCLDEMGQIDGREAGEVAYMLANEAGKGRMSKEVELKKRRTWKLLFLSTGELSLQEKLNEVNKRSYAGMETRFVDIPADAGKGYGLFDNAHNFKDAGSLAQHLRDNTQKIYGTPIRAYLKCLTEQNRAELTRWITQNTKQFADRYSPADADGQVMRVCQRFGLLATAGELASSYGILPVTLEDIQAGIAICFQAWLEQRGTHGDLETLRGVEQVKNFFEKYGDSRFGIARSVYDGAEEYDLDQNWHIHDRVGYKRKDMQGYWEYMVYPTAFKNDLCKGLNAMAIARALIREGMLIASKNGDPSTVCKLPKPDGNAKRMYIFSCKVME